MLLPVYLLLATTMTALIEWMGDFTLLGLQGLCQRRAGISFRPNWGTLALASYCDIFTKEEHVEYMV